jgi:hypothetical protein
MYATTRISGPTVGLGDALPVACSGSSCYATSPAAEQSLQALQDLLSRFASKVGAQPLQPDYVNGKRVALIGPATVSLASKVAQYLATLYRTPGTMTLLGMVTNASDLAKFGATFTQIASQYASGLPTPATPKPTVPTTTTTSFPTPTSMIPPPFAPPSAGMSRNTMLVIAGVAAVVVAGVVYYVWIRED